MHRGILHPGLRSVRPYALDCRDFCIAMPVSYLSSDVFAVCKCLILLARWEPLTAWPVRSKHAAVVTPLRSAHFERGVLNVGLAFPADDIGRPLSLMGRRFLRRECPAAVACSWLQYKEDLERVNLGDSVTVGEKNALSVDMRAYR